MNMSRFVSDCSSGTDPRRREGSRVQREGVVVRWPDKARSRGATLARLLMSTHKNIVSRSAAPATPPPPSSRKHCSFEVAAGILREQHVDFRLRNARCQKLRRYHT